MYRIKDGLILYNLVEEKFFPNRSYKQKKLINLTDIKKHTGQNTNN